jgi:flagellar protein FlaJ
MTRKVILLSLLIILIGNILPIAIAQGENTPPVITNLSPFQGETVETSTPEIKVEYVDASGIDINSVKIVVDGYDVSDWDETTITSTSITYIPPEFLGLKEGNHSATIQVSDIHGNTATETWTFIVKISLFQAEEEPIDVFAIIIYVLIGTAIILTAFTLYIIYLKKTKKFTFKKYFIQHKIKKEVFVFYIPLIIAFFVIIFGLAIASKNPFLPAFSMEYILIIGIFIAIGPFAIYSPLERRKIAKYERAFSQFLFEMADAMRGGLDPTKALIELSKSDTGVLKNHLKRAADSIKLGRPFDEIMEAMVRPIKSDLLKRYASLIGETSKIGGETSQVIHRAAKDMDDFLKINQERRRQLMAQTTTIYIAFGVLLLVLYQLITMFPSLEGMDASLFGATELESAEAKVITRMSFFTLKQRFFHLVIINSLGTGTIIGMFIDGNVKHGLIHSLILTAFTTVFFIVLIL